MISRGQLKLITVKIWANVQLRLYLLNDQQRLISSQTATLFVTSGGKVCCGGKPRKGYFSLNEFWHSDASRRRCAWIIRNQ